MATEVIPAPLGEVRSATTAGGGTALTSTAARIVLARGTKHITLIPRNYAGAAVVQFNKNPFLTILKTTNLLATQAALTDYSDNAQDSSTTTKVTLNSLDTIANLNAVYIGASVPFSGVDIDVSAANSNASVLTVKYRKSDNTWADTSATDNSASGGATFAVDGTVTWTMPTDWISTSLVGAETTALKNMGLFEEQLYWTRWEVSAALDSTTDCNSMISINRSTAYAELPVGLGWQESITVGRGGVFSIQAKTDAGTANLIINQATRSGGMF